MAGSGTLHLRPDQERVLSAEHVVVEFDAGVHGKVQAVSDVSLDVLPGESLGMAFDGLVHVNGHWAWFPKPWRALGDE